mgnify:CR=1 FL=1
MRHSALSLRPLRVIAAALIATSAAADLFEAVEHRYADNAGTKIHYALSGREGPLVVMVHGFPDFWYSWRTQMTALHDRFRVAAMDLRGYNRSDQPRGIENYAMPLLVADVAAVIAAEEAESAVVVAHDWGGAIAWNLAMSRPDLVSHLVILNLPHPLGLMRELANNPQQKQNSGYAYQFQQPDAHKALTAEGLAGWVTDDAARLRYVAAFERSSFEGMLNYYKANYPKPPAADAPAPAMPKVEAPVLMFHGLEDQALLPGALSGTWDWVEKDLTLVTIPGANHFVQQDAADMVSETMRDWLLRRIE